MPEIPPGLFGDAAQLVEYAWTWASQIVGEFSGLIALVVGLGVAGWILRMLVGLFREQNPYDPGDLRNYDPEDVRRVFDDD